MSIRPRYKTKQKDVLIEYFKSIPGTHVTAGEVVNVLIERGEPIGQATVYRHLESLVNEGILKKYVIDGNSPACFEYVEADDHLEGSACFHCKCEKCGRLIHLNCVEMIEIKEHLMRHHQFRMDPYRTVFYGICQECAEKEDDPHIDID